MRHKKTVIIIISIIIIIIIVIIIIDNVIYCNIFISIFPLYVRMSELQKSQWPWPKDYVRQLLQLLWQWNRPCMVPFRRVCWYKNVNFMYIYEQV